MIEKNIVSALCSVCEERKIKTILAESAPTFLVDCHPESTTGRIVHEIYFEEI